MAAAIKDTVFNVAGIRALERYAEVCRCKQRGKVPTDHTEHAYLMLAPGCPFKLPTLSPSLARELKTALSTKTLPSRVIDCYCSQSGPRCLCVNDSTSRCSCRNCIDAAILYQQSVRARGVSMAECVCTDDITTSLKDRIGHLLDGYEPARQSVSFSTVVPVRILADLTRPVWPGEVYDLDDFITFKPSSTGQAGELNFSINLANIAGCLVEQTRDFVPGRIPYGLDYAIAILDHAHAAVVKSFTPAVAERDQRTLFPIRHRDRDTSALLSKVTSPVPQIRTDAEWELCLNLGRDLFLMLQIGKALAEAITGNHYDSVLNLFTTVRDVGAPKRVPFRSP